jgi:NuA3 HAT complex component NTO1
MELRAKLDQRFYTTTGAFAKDLSAKFTLAIMNDSLSAKGLASDDIEKKSPNKKLATDIRDRRKLGKRIIKAVQPMLEAALRAECDVLKKPVDDQLANLNILLDSCLLPPEGSSGLQEALADLHGAERSQDDDMPDAIKASNTEPTELSGNLEGEAVLKSESINGDVEMSDVNMDHDAEDVIHVDSMIDPALRDLGAPIIQIAGEVKESRTNGITPPETYGYSSTVEVTQITPPTPPVSTGENPTESADVLNNGGILWYVKDFQPEGTSVLQDVAAEHTNGSVDSEELSDMDEEDIRALADPAAGPSVQSSTPATKAKKAKSRKKWRGFK